jgi:hypothetical protein
MTITPNNPMSAEWMQHSEFQYSTVLDGVRLTLLYCGMPPRLLTQSIEDSGWWTARYQTADMPRSERIPSFFRIDAFGRTIASVRGLQNAQQNAEAFTWALTRSY